MKLIVAIVRPFTIEKIVVALEEIEGFPGITVSDTEGFGQRLHANIDDALNPFKPNKRIEIVAEEEMVEPIIASIKEHAHTGRKGDGFAVVLKIEGSILI